MHVVSAYSGVAVKKIDYRWAYRRHTYNSVWLDDRISGIRSMDCFILSSREFALSARTQVFL